jgi:hypothetical protein
MLREGVEKDANLRHPNARKLLAVFASRKIREYLQFNNHF